MPAKKRGGRRPGAGAPRGNLNGLKSGQYSRQVKALKLALKAAPSTAALLHNLDAAADNKRVLFAKALQHYAELILIGNPSAIQSMKTGQIDPAQIRDLLQNVESNQAIKVNLLSRRRPVSNMAVGWWLRYIHVFEAPDREVEEAQGYRGDADEGCRKLDCAAAEIGETNVVEAMHEPECVAANAEIADAAQKRTDHAFPENYVDQRIG